MLRFGRQLRPLIFTSTGHGRLRDFLPPIGDQFVQQDRRKIYGGDVSHMIPGDILGFDTQTRSAFRRTPTTFILIWRKRPVGRAIYRAR
jgi:hypothetical protein